MESVGEDLEALDQAGAGAAEIGVAIDEKDSAVARTRQPTEPRLGEEDREILTDAWDVKPAAGDHEHFRIGRHNLLPGNRPRLLPLPPKHLPATGEDDDLGRPVACRERRINPLEEHDARRPHHASRPARDRVDPSLEARHNPPAPFRNAGRIGNCLMAREHLRKTRRLEIHHARISGKPAGGRSHLRLGYRADIAQRLRDDEIGGEPLENGQIEFVESAIRAESFTDERIDLPARGVGGNERSGHVGKAPHRGWMVAFVGHADEVIPETELADDLGSAGKKGDDSHERALGRTRGGKSMMGSSVAVGRVRSADDPGQARGARSMRCSSGRHHRAVSLCALVAISLLTRTSSRADDGLTLFETRIRPVLVEHCQECHRSDGAAEGGLVLDHRAGMRAGGAGGPILVPGAPDQSRLLAILRHELPGLEMPEGGKRLDDDTLAAFSAWIAAGAPDPRDPPASGATKAPADFAERRTWWSFQPLLDPDLPPAHRADWSENPIDRFLAARLEAAGLEPAPLAQPAGLLRRLSFVLTGLPPSPEEVLAFTADPSPAAYEAAVDRMLASPHFGERFARHWMDLVRYCESHGSQGDPELPNAWRYRDYLVRSFNDDLPYDRFVREQIAGDLLPDPRWNAAEGFNESAIGPAHLRMVELGFVPVDALDDQVKVIENQIDVYSKTFFALTAACARCHDHKFDPVTQEDFYALAGVLTSSRPGQVILDRPESLGAADAELTALKASIKEGLVTAWLEAAEKLPARLSEEAERRARATALRAEHATVIAAVDRIEKPARAAALAQRGLAPLAAALPTPLARWSFSGDTCDSLGGLDGELLGGAVVRDGRLVLDGVGANMRTKALPRDLSEKTLEAWVVLANLDQRGGGVIGLDMPEGRFFDSIVFGEMKPRHWLAGSDFFNRTADPGGTEETAGPGELIHVAIAWAADGSIALYRNGASYGERTTKGSPWTFKAGGARFLFGQRLSDINPPLAGEIDEARAYDRALSPEEIAASFRAGPEGVTDDELLATLDAATKASLLHLRAERDRISTDLRVAETPAADPLGPLLTAASNDPANPFHAWAKLTATPTEAWPATWNALAATLEADRRARTETSARATPLWDLRGPDHASWFRHGPGLGPEPTGNGAFTVVPDGEAVIAGILPAGIHTHLLSNRQSGVYQSPRFVIDTDSVYVRVLGRGAVARLVIENYPIGNGGIYPAVRPDRDDLGWIRLDTNYRRGSSAYVELVTDPAERAFFGIAAVMKGDAPEPPRDTFLAAAPFLDGAPPNTAAEFAARMATRLGDTIRAWRDGTLDDDGRALLDIAGRSRLLPTMLPELPAIAATVERYRAIERAIPLARRAPGVLEAAGYDAPLFIRGQHTRPAALVPRRGLSLFGNAPYAEQAEAANAPSGRLQLADEAVGPGRDLLARVMVNRLWHHVYGRGLVVTTDNFGLLGALPTHPDLLDWLAGRFIDESWSVKRALRRMVMSRAFRGSAVPSPAATQTDPQNELLSHAPLRRLDAESIRDSILATSGQLDPSRGGPGIDVYHTAKTEGGGPVGPLDGHRRRSLYQRIRRNASNPFLEVFDAPKPATTRGTRDVTGGPVQALAMLNDPFVVDQATKWGVSVAATPDTDEARLRGMMLRALARSPDSEETALLLAHLAAVRAPLAVLPDGSPRPAAEAEALAWGDMAHAILCLKEFIHVE